MNERDERAAFRRGMRQFNTHKFWHAHESWESIWLTAPEPDKTFLQGIIQISAAFYHHQRGNLEGMRSLMRRGLAKVEQLPAGYRRSHNAICRAARLPGICLLTVCCLLALSNLIRTCS